MSNQLIFNFKPGEQAPIKQTLRDYIFQNHDETHPDSFKNDLSTWESMRSSATSKEVRVAAVDSIVAYHAQLVFILTKLPPDIGLPITYASDYPCLSRDPLTLSNLCYERVCVLYNLASLFCQLAALEDRSTTEGLKRAIGHFQKAAGTLSYLIEHALPALAASLPKQNKALETVLPADLNTFFLKSLHFLMLAQAQECFWQTAVIAGYKDALVAKLATQVSTYYTAAAGSLDSAPYSVKYSFPPGWLAHIQTKSHHFEAAAQYRKSIDASNTNKYGEQIARLLEAQGAIKKAAEIGRKGSIAKTVQNDVKSLVQKLTDSLITAQRDNDLIYHQDVPAPSGLELIEGKGFVNAVVLLGLADPTTVVSGGDGAIFANLESWGVRTAIQIYENRKEDWIQAEIIDTQQKLDSEATKALRKLNLPMSLDALQKPVGLPPSTLRNAEEIRLERGPETITLLTEDIEKLRITCRSILDESLDVLDAEASDDEADRVSHSFSDQWILPPSHEVNKPLTEEADKYRDMLDNAAESDAIVRRRWEEWEERIEILASDESTIEAAVPSNTASSTTGRPGENQTRIYAQELRALLEQLDDLTSERAHIVLHARRAADNDSIKPRIMREASGIERWVQVKPAMFEDTMDEELGKFERFRNDLNISSERQTELLEQIAASNDLFLQSRRDDPSIKAREHALQSLDATFHKYQELKGNLHAATKFYNDFAVLVGEFKETCKGFVKQRRDDVRLLEQSLSKVSPPTSPPVEQAPALAARRPEAPISPPRQPIYALDLPRPDSGAWEDDFNSLYIGPQRTPQSTRGTKTQAGRGRNR